MSTVLAHIVTMGPQCELNACLKCAARGLLKNENTGRKNYAKNRHLRTIAQICWAISSQRSRVSIIEKKLVKRDNISSICPHNMLNFSPLTAEICLGVFGTPTNVNGFRILASLRHRRRSMDVNQTLHDVWPSPALVYYVYIFEGFCPNGIMPAAKFGLRPSLLFSYIGGVTARHSRSGRQRKFAASYKE